MRENLIYYYEIRYIHLWIQYEFFHPDITYIIICMYTVKRFYTRVLSLEKGMQLNARLLSEELYFSP